MNESYRFSWVHLSDIHFNHGDVAQGLDQQLVLHELRSDIEAFNKHNIPKPEAIFITGDIAFSGNVRKDVEYDNAHRWISLLAEAVNIKEDRIFVVPGNHDVQRNIVQHDKNAARLLESLRSGNEKIDNALEHPDDRALLVSRLKNYIRPVA
jgi:3',5'-cyclic AMP phosphodiesterase CpdA